MAEALELPDNYRTGHLYKVSCCGPSLFNFVVMNEKSMSTPEQIKTDLARADIEDRFVTTYLGPCGIQKPETGE